MNEPTQSSRRSFLQNIAGVSAVTAFTGLQLVKNTFGAKAAALQALESPSAVPGKFDGGYWEEIRRQFMMEEGFAYMNNGTLGPTPRPVFEAMVEYWRLMAENPHENSNMIQNHEREVLRFKAATFLDVDPDEVAITRNTTEGNTILAQGQDYLKQGDEILISAFEHQSCRQAWMREARRRGYVVKEVSYNNPPRGKDEIIEAFEGAISSRSRIIHLANPTPGYGCFQPMKELAELAHRKGMLCFVDGAHCLGHIPFSLRDWNVDAFACNAHKWMCGAAGAGLLFVRRDLQKKIWPNISLLTEEQESSMGAKKYAYSVGRRPWPVVGSFSNSFDFHLAIGRQRTEERLRALGSYLREKAAAIPRVSLYTSNDPELSAGITTLEIEGVSGRQLAEHLRQRHNIYVPGGGRTRISTNYFNTFEQVDRVLEGLNELALARR